MTGHHYSTDLNQEKEDGTSTEGWEHEKEGLRNQERKGKNEKNTYGDQARGRMNLERVHGNH